MPRRGWVWVYNPHTGGLKIPAAVREQTERRIQAYAAKRHAGKYTRLEIRFRGALCYIDAYVEPAKPTAALLQALGETRKEHLERLRTTPLHLCRRPSKSASSDPRDDSRLLCSYMI